MRRFGRVIAIALALSIALRSAIGLAEPPATLRAIEPRPAGSAETRIKRLPPVERRIQPETVQAARQNSPQRARVVSFQEELASPAPEEISAPDADQPTAWPIDLPTALKLADANNLQVAFARQQVEQALALAQKANALWLPTIQTGGNYNRHEGSIQRVEGTQILTSRAAFYGGLGAGGYSASSPSIPGLYANFSLTDAFYQPLAARQLAGARSRAAAAVTNDMLLQVALLYLELLRAGEDVAIGESARRDAQRLVEITSAYAETGQGLASDANRAQTELAIRVNDVRRSGEAQGVASARLAQLLRLSPTLRLEPADPVTAPVEIISPDVPVKELVAQGLSLRPELAESQLLVGQAVALLKRERMAMVLPSVLLGASYGGMGSGIDEQLAPFHDRLDFDAIAYWQLRNLGFGEAAARRAAQSNVQSSQLRQLALMDQIAREVVEAHIQIRARRRQMATARAGLSAALASQQQNLERIEQAKGLPIEVLQSNQALAQARREYLRTVIDYNTAQFSLYRALGWPVMLPALAPVNSGQ